jgi:hypothetical protein
VVDALIWVFLGLVLAFGASVWTYGHARSLQERGAELSPLIWATLTFLALIPALPVYLLLNSMVWQKQIQEQRLATVDRPRSSDEPGLRGEQDRLPVERPQYPRAVRIAGVVWIVFGCLSLTLLNPGIGLLVSFGMPAGQGDWLAGAACPIMLTGMLFGILFIYVGVQSVRGTAKDLGSNGVGSLIFGVLDGSFGLFLIISAAEAPGGLMAAILGGINFLAGVGLLAAGRLALGSREAYKAWHKAQSVHLGKSARG